MIEPGMIVQGELTFSGALVDGATLLTTTRGGGHSEPPFGTLNTSRSVGDAPECVLANRLAVLQALGISEGGLALVGQVHGTKVARVTDAGPLMGVLCQADGMITSAAGPALAVSIADCQAILVHDTRTGARAAAHAGWRGTLAGMATTLIAAMSAEFATDPMDCVAYLSPCIGPCCYRVADDVAHPLEIEPGAKRYLFRRQGCDWQLDLRSENMAQIIAAGIPAPSVIDDAHCTACREDLFFSHVRDAGRTGRMWAIIGREKNCD